MKKEKFFTIDRVFEINKYMTFVCLIIFYAYETFLMISAFNVVANEGLSQTSFATYNEFSGYLVRGVALDYVSSVLFAASLLIFNHIFHKNQSKLIYVITGAIVVIFTICTLILTGFFV